MSDHFPNFTIIEKFSDLKCDINEENTRTFKFILGNTDWYNFLPLNSGNKAYVNFLIFFSDFYEIASSKKEIRNNINT